MYNPFIKFNELFSTCNQYNKMSIATTGSDNQPTMRNVILKSYDENGFVFNTRKSTVKNKNLLENPKIAILFDWIIHNYQIRIEGKIIESSQDAMHKFFTSCSREKQIKAWANKQFDTISNIEELNKMIEYFHDKFKNQDVPYIDYWTEYTVIPHYFEFWYNDIDDGFYKREKYHLRDEKWLFNIYYEK